MKPALVRGTHIILSPTFKSTILFREATKKKRFFWWLPWMDRDAKVDKATQIEGLILCESIIQ